MQRRDLWPQLRDIAGVFQHIVRDRQTVFPRGLCPHNCRYLRGCQFVPGHDSLDLALSRAINHKHAVDAVSTAPFHQQRDADQAVGIAGRLDLGVSLLSNQRVQNAFQLFA